MSFMAYAEFAIWVSGPFRVMVRSPPLPDTHAHRSYTAPAGAFPCSATATATFVCFAHVQVCPVTRCPCACGVCSTAHGDRCTHLTQRPGGRSPTGSRAQKAGAAKLTGLPASQPADVSASRCPVIEAAQVCRRASPARPRWLLRSAALVLRATYAYATNAIAIGDEVTDPRTRTRPRGFRGGASFRSDLVSGSTPLVGNDIADHSRDALRNQARYRSGYSGCKAGLEGVWFANRL